MNAELTNIYFLTKEELTSLQEDIYILLEEFIKNDPLCIGKENFDDIFMNNIHTILSEQLQQLNINHNLQSIIEDTMKKFYSHFMPSRSYSTSFIRKKPNIPLIDKKIQFIKDIPQPAQRTDEWYEFRHKYLTASSAWKAFSTESAQNQLIYAKCCPLNLSRYSAVDITSPMHHGQKYEPVSIMYYEEKYNTEITDFGCIPHQECSFLAASPDGINTKQNNDRYGRMLEIKNIVNRKITGIPKFEYWIQMQLQMETCNLNECDFLETRFIEYKSKEDFENDNTFTKSHDNKMKGIIMYFEKDYAPIYEYCPLNYTEDEFKEWEAATLKKNADLLWIKNIYWKLDTISCVLVLRNKIWFNAAEKQLRNIWDTIQNEKGGDYTHRAPKKRKKYTAFNDIQTSKCLINIMDNDNDKDNDKDNDNDKLPTICQNKVIEINTEKLNG